MILTEEEKSRRAVPIYEVVTGGAGVWALSPLDAATAIPTTTATPSTIRRPLSMPASWAFFTPAGAPGESGFASPANAAELVKAIASTNDTKRILMPPKIRTRIFIDDHLSGKPQNPEFRA
jgi:hypothetical protein